MDSVSDTRLGRHRAKLTPAVLRRIDFFRDVPEAEFGELAGVSRRQAYQRHAVIAGPEDEERPFFVVAEGLVGIAAMSPDGWREFIGLLLSPHDLFSLRDLPAPLGEMTQARALSNPTIVYRVPARQFAAAKHASRAMHRLVEQQTNRYLHMASETLLDFVFLDAPTRFTRMLGRLALQREDCSVWFTHEELGMLTGLKRQKVTEYLGDLADRGLVSHAPYQRGVTVPNPARLIEAPASGFQLSQR